jgi:glycosyltransferase involved in cell wall biosynthesis
VDSQKTLTEESSLRILLAHNLYQQRGGEDVVVESEAELLERHGHRLAWLERHNDDIRTMNRMRLARDTLWSPESARACRAAIADFRPDVIHVHNSFPLLSPAIYWAAAKAGVPVVQTLHNFRLLCPQAMFLRQGKVCEDCLGHVPWRAAMHGCYHDSPLQSSLVAGMLTAHRLIGTWRHRITRYIALNEFCKRKFIAGGLPAERIAIKPNFVDIPREESGPRQGGLFVGRLAAEKGIAVLLNALDLVEGARVRVAGEGPEKARIIAHGCVKALGHRLPSEIYLEMRHAAYLVMPSLWYENFPRTLVEAQACGLPVIASRLGALAELIDDGRTGLLFEAGNAADLAEKIRWAENHSGELVVMGQASRRQYEENYTADINYRQLVAIYSDAMAAFSGERASS